MPDRHRHDEFHWALIFSLIVNLLIVSAIVLPPRGRTAARSPTVIVSIEATKMAPRTESAVAVDTVTRAKSNRTITVRTPTPNDSSRLAINKPLILPVIKAAEATSSITTLSEPERAETAQSLPEAANGTAATLVNKSAGGSVIIGDKNTEDHYTAPERLIGAEPRYPQQARRHGWEGKVLMTLSINKEGQVERVDLTESSGYDLLDRSAREAVAAWRFKPARRNGMAVAETVRLPFIFRLNSTSGSSPMNTKSQPNNPSSPKIQAEKRR